MRRVILICLMSITGLVGADNVLTPQEKAQGWVLLFDGKTLNGWDSVNTSAGGRGRGQSGGGPAQGKAAPQPGAAAQVGSNPRPCSTPVGLAAVSAGASHWEVVDGLLVP